MTPPERPTTPQRRYFPGPVPRALAHRGLALQGEENTLAAFRAAIRAGAHVIETDTRASADGVALTFHDAMTGRVCAEDLEVATTRAATLTRMPVGQSFADDARITRLDDALAALPTALFNIDVKDARAIEPTIEAIARAGAEARVCLTSFSPAIAREASRALAARTGHVPVRSASADTVALFRLAVSAGAPDVAVRRLLSPFAALQIPVAHRGIPLVSPRTIAAAHRAGCEIHVWTIDEAPHMRALIEMGVDGIVTNRVDVLADVCARAWE
ncbi:MAG: glycerophosphodiester phosphodiesterase family protein [Dermabacter sp.]|nr:glycerophosphodiester phosphodiesterase family protein [Dermabacter sp.]